MVQDCLEGENEEVVNLYNHSYYKRNLQLPENWLKVITSYHFRKMISFL